MYLSNVDRERLGLHGYTSDVPAGIVEAAEAALAARAARTVAAEAAAANRPSTKRAKQQAG